MEGTPSVGLQEAVLKALSNWKDCNTRSRRSEFWWVYLICVLIEIPLAVLAQIIMDKFISIVGLIIYLVALVIALFMICVMFSLAIRRLHDTGREGWWILIGLVPVVGGVILLVFMILDSQREANDYGPSSKYSSSSSPGEDSSSKMV